MKIISRGTNKKGQSTAQVIVNGKTKHLIQQAFGGLYFDQKGMPYDLK